MDKRNAELLEQGENRLQIEMEHNSILRAEGERRLKLEAAIQAVNLLSTSAGVDVPQTQRAAVLFTLADLGLLDLTITMLNQMLFTEKIDSNSAIWVINRCLETNNVHLQTEAAELLNKYHYKFLLERGESVFPRLLDLSWNVELPELARQEASRALMSMIVARCYKELNVGFFDANVVTLISIWKTEASKIIKRNVGLFLNEILKVYEQGDTLSPPSGDIMIDEILAELEVGLIAYPPSSSLYGPIIQQAREWVEKLD